MKGSENGISDALSLLCPNLAHLALPLSPSLIGEYVTASMSALETSVAASDEENEAIQQCRSAVVGHGGVDRTVIRLLSRVCLAEHASARKQLYPTLPLLSKNERRQRTR